MTPTLAAAVALLAAAPARPNVLFVVADDLRAEAGCYGGAAKAPHLDALAARGVRFDRAYCQQALCNPSRSSFLTGRRPDTLGLWVNGTHFRAKNPDVVTLPEWFKGNGYETRCVGKIFHNWHTTPRGDRRSWSADEFLHYANHGDDVAVVDGDAPPDAAPKVRRSGYAKHGLCECRDVPDGAYYDGRVAAEAVRVLGEVKDRPFFLAVGFWKPHAPFNAPKRYWDLYDPKAVGPPEPPGRPAGAPAWAFHDNTELLGPPGKQLMPNAAEVNALRHGYLANVSYMDAQLGKVIAALDGHGLASRTVVVFVSDHGYHVGEHGLWAKTSNFERDARVPLVVVPPGGAAAGRATPALAELVDLFPTLTDLCGLKAPAGLDGTSLAPVLADPAKPGKAAAFTQHPRPAYPDRTPAGVPQVMGYSARTAAARYTEWRDWATGKLLAAEFYDHARDPRETANRLDAAAGSDALLAARRALHDQFSPGK